jgi:hypothetical protein
MDECFSGDLGNDVICEEGLFAYILYMYMLHAGFHANGSSVIVSVLSSTSLQI